MIFDVNQYGLFVFDLDGTLLDTKQRIISCLWEAIASQGLEPPSPGEVENIRIGPPVREIIKKLISYRDEKVIENVESSFRRYYDEDPFHGVNIYPGCLDFLKFLRKKEIKLAVATNKPKCVAGKLLQHYFDGYFYRAYSPDSFPDQILPKSKILELLMKESLSVAAMMVGDTISDGEAARKNNIDFLFFESGYEINKVNVKKEATYSFNSYSQLL